MKIEKKIFFHCQGEQNQSNSSVKLMSSKCFSLFIGSLKSFSLNLSKFVQVFCDIEFRRKKQNLQANNKECQMSIWTSFLGVSQYLIKFGAEFFSRTFSLATKPVLLITDGRKKDKISHHSWDLKCELILGNLQNWKTVEMCKAFKIFNNHKEHRRKMHASLPEVV